MAGDWLKIEKDTPEKPEIAGISAALDISPEVAFAKCFKLWRWADSNLESGHAPRVTKAFLDSIVGMSGFAQAMVDVGWLSNGNDAIEFPNFDRHMSQSAKRRGLAANRKQKQRGAECHAPRVTKAGPEKRREEKNKRREKSAAKPPPRPRNELFDAIAEVTGFDPATSGPLIGKVSATLKDAGYTPDDVREFARRYWEFCPYARDSGGERPTPPELEKYIGRIRASPAPSQPPRGAPRTKAQDIADTAARSLQTILENQKCLPPSAPAIPG